MEENKKTESTDVVNDNKIISVELTKQQYAFLENWQKKHETELGIEVPVGALVRKIVENAMNTENKPERSGRPERRDGDRKSFGDKPRSGGFGGDRRGGDRGGFKSSGGRGFGDQHGGSKFSMLGKNNKSRTFGDK